MTDPVDPYVRGAIVAALGVLLFASGATSPWVLHVSVLALGGLALVPVLGWLRTLWFAPVAAAGLAAWAAASLLHHGQAVPVAAVAATVVGMAAGAAAAAGTERVAQVVRPWISVLLVALVWGVILPRVASAPTPQPMLFGIDLSGDRPLAALALALLAFGVWSMGNLARSRVGREIAVAGSSPKLAQRSGARIAGAWVSAGAVSGLFAGWIGLLLALDVQGVPTGAQFSPATAVIWVAVPLIGGPAWISGALVGALIVGGLPAVLQIPEAAVAGLGLVAVTVTRGRGLVGEIAHRTGRAT